MATDDLEIVWEDPPGDGRHRRNHQDPLLETIRTNPGKWAVVYEGSYPHQNASALRGKFLRRGEKDLWEVQARATGGAITANQTGKVYVRYVGGDHAAE